MNKLLCLIKSIPDYFDKNWWSFTQDSQYYFCDKGGNIILPESYLNHNPFRHFLMCIKYDLKYWTDCDSENSIFASKNYDLVEINKICKKHKIKEAWNIQFSYDGINSEHYDLSLCCFCNRKLKDYGNSTWPIYYKNDGYKNRCCNKCNKKYVIPSRLDNSLIMTFRNKFGIDYTEYKEVKK